MDVVDTVVQLTFLKESHNPCKGNCSLPYLLDLFKDVSNHLLLLGFEAMPLVVSFGESAVVLVKKRVVEDGHILAVLEKSLLLLIVVPFHELTGPSLLRKFYI